MTFIYGRDCEIGYGFNEEYECFDRFDQEDDTVYKTQMNNSHLELIDLKSQLLSKTDRLGPLLTSEYLKYLDFLNASDKKSDCLMRINVTSKSHKGKKRDYKYPEGTVCYVNKINFMLQIDVIFDVASMDCTREELVKLLRERLNKKSWLSEDQQKVNCRVLINFRQTRYMVLGKVFAFAYAFEKGHCPEYEIPMMAYNRKIARGNDTTNLVLEQQKLTSCSNGNDLAVFLKYLYMCYRRIELKLKTANFSIAPNPVFTTDSFQESSDEVKKMFKIFRKLWIQFESKNMHLFVRKMYKIIKQFFFACRNYVRNIINYKMEVKQKYYGNLNESDILEKLNRWRPVPGFIIPKKFKHVAGMLRQTEKWSGKDVTIEICDDDDEEVPLFFNPPDETFFFGFVDMKHAALGKSNSPLEKRLMNKKCPQKCSDDPRKWICKDCGEFVRINLTAWTIGCNCGSKVFNQKYLECVHSKEVLLE